MGKIVQLRVRNWDEYNRKRKDVSEPGWLRLEKKLPMSKSLFGVKAADRYVFVTLLCLACEEQSADLEFDSEWFTYAYGCGAFSESDLLSAIERLDGKVIETKKSADTTIVVPTEVGVTPTAPPRTADVTDTLRYETRRDDTERNVTDEEGELPPPAERTGLEDLNVGTFLDDAPEDPLTPGLLLTLIDGYGLALVRDVIPRARAGWEGDPARRTDFAIATKGGRFTYLRNWLENERKDGEKKPRAGPRGREKSTEELLRERQTGGAA